jgi:hypothetical protein
MNKNPSILNVESDPQVQINSFRDSVENCIIILFSPTLLLSRRLIDDRKFEDSKKCDMIIYDMNYLEFHILPYSNAL